jgi:hypothetical protein
MTNLYQCTFLDEFSESKMIICDLPTSNPKEILNIINSCGLEGGFEFMTTLNGLISIKQQDENFKPNNKTIKFYII